MKRALSILLIVGAFLLGLWMSYSIFAAKETVHSESNTQIVYEEIKKVCKLVTVEGIYNERFDSLNNRSIPLFFPLSYSYKFPKEATISVTGKVLVGYNMGEMTITMDDVNKQIVLNNIPEPEILAIDHDVTYEYIEESWFNKFSPKDFTALNKSAKDAIRKSGASDELLIKAEIEGNQMIEIINLIAEMRGYALVVKKKEPAPLLN